MLAKYVKAWPLPDIFGEWPRFTILTITKIGRNELLSNHQPILVVGFPGFSPRSNLFSCLPWLHDGLWSIASD